MLLVSLVSDVWLFKTFHAASCCFASGAVDLRERIPQLGNHLLVVRILARVDGVHHDHGIRGVRQWLWGRGLRFGCAAAS